MIKHFGPIYIDFDEYLPFSDALSENFVTNIHAHIRCNNIYPYSTTKGNMLTWTNKGSWEMTKKGFPDAKQVKKCPTTTVCKICTYVKNERKKINEGFDFPPDN